MGRGWAKQSIHLLFAKGKFYFQQFFFTLLWTLQKEAEERSEKEKAPKTCLFFFHSQEAGVRLDEDEAAAVVLV